MAARLRLVMLLLLAGAAFPSAPMFVAATTSRVDSGCALRSVSFAVNGRSAPLLAARRGDHVVVSFEVPSGCSNRLTFASFVAPDPAFDGSRLREQVRFSDETATFSAGRHSMAVDVFGFPERTIRDCPSAEVLAAVRNHMARSPEFREQVEQQVQAEAAAERGANQSGPYDSTCDGSASQNGNGSGEAGGRPCAGCVGNADGKNPPGQRPDGNDHNAGYECDRNHGIGRGNPAHSGCQHFQVDFAYRPEDDEPGSHRGHERGLIAAVFCLRMTPVCYVTDNTGSDAAVGA